MSNPTSRGTARARRQTLDHLAPGARNRSAKDSDASQPATGAGTARSDTPQAANEPTAQPAEAPTPGGAASDAVRGKATRSPAAVATRPHLEGSEQGPS